MAASFGSPSVYVQKWFNDLTNGGIEFPKAQATIPFFTKDKKGIRKLFILIGCVG
jgi:hypothetical protein